MITIECINKALSIATDMLISDKTIIPFIMIDNSYQCELDDKCKDQFIFKGILPALKNNEYRKRISTKEIKNKCKQWMNKTKNKTLSMVLVYDSYITIDNEERNVHEKWDAIKFDVHGSTKYYYNRYVGKKLLGPLLVSYYDDENT